MNMLIAMAIAAVLCVAIGVWPEYLYAMLPWQMDYWPYDVSHVLAQLQLLFFAALAFVWMEIKHYAPPELHATNLDAEWSYRKLLPATGRFVYRTTRQIGDSIIAAVNLPMQSVHRALLRSPLMDRYLTGNWPTGGMVFWIAVILGGFVLLDNMS